MDKDYFNFLLKRKGITQEEIADCLGITRQSLSNRLRGTVEWSLSEIKTVCERLKLEDADIKQIFFKK